MLGLTTRTLFSGSPASKTSPLSLPSTTFYAAGFIPNFPSSGLLFDGQPVWLLPLAAQLELRPLASPPGHLHYSLTTTVQSFSSRPLIISAMTPPSQAPMPGSGKLPVRKHDFGVLPIPKYCRFDPNLSPEEQPKFTWRINLVFALAAVSPCCVLQSLSLMNRQHRS